MTLRHIDKALDEITTMTYGGPNPSFIENNIDVPTWFLCEIIVLQSYITEPYHLFILEVASLTYAKTGSFVYYF